MSEIGGDISNDPFSPKQTTTQIFPIPIQTSTSAFVFPITPTTPTPSIPPLTFSTEATEVITKTKLDPSLPAISTVSHRGTNTLTLAVPKGQGSNNNNNNTISTAAIIFSIMIGFVIVGGCITLIFTRKRHPENKKKRTEIIQRNLYGEEPCELNESNDNDRIVVINSISPPLNLPPPPPQRSPHPPSSPRDSLPLPPIPQFPPPPQHLPSSSPSPSPPPTPEHPPPQPLPSIPQHSPIVLYRNPSLKRNGSKNNYDYNISEDYYQRYSQLRPPSASASASSANSYNNVEDRPTSEPP